MIACGGGGDGDTGGDGVKPLDSILTEIVEPMGWDEAGTRIYIVPEPLQAGQTIAPALNSDGTPSVAITIDKPTWFAWGDLSPDLYFSHSTRFIFMDEDGSNLRSEEQQWFPLIDDKVFHPAVADWGANSVSARVVDAKIGVAEPGVSYASVADECGHKARAILFQGFAGNNDYLNVSATRVWNALAERPYEKVYDLRFAVEPDNIKRKQMLLNEILPELAGLSDLGQLDIFYMGHGAQGLWVLGGDPEGYSPTIQLDDIAEELEGISVEKLNIVVDSCHSGAWAASLDAKTSPTLDGADVKVLASCSPTEKSGYGADGSRFTEGLMDLLVAQPKDEPFDYNSVVVPQMQYKARTAAGIVDTTQSPENHVAPPENPIIYLADHPDQRKECQVAAVVDLNNYERKVTLRGVGFGDTEGFIGLYRWDFDASSGLGLEQRFPLGAELILDVVYWSDNAITFTVPMRSQGFPSDADKLDLKIEAERFSAPSLTYRQIGRYFVQVTTADGKKSADYRELSQANYASYAPQFVHVQPQVETQEWTPDYTSMTSVEWNEMWLSMTPASQSLGQASVLVSDMRLVGNGEDAFPTMAWGWTWPELAEFPRANSEHTTGFQAQSYYDTWTYELAAGERNLDTAYIQSAPEFNYWGFRQLFAAEWQGTATWKYTLVYD